MYELIRIHRKVHQKDKVSEIISGYPYWEDTLIRTVKELKSRTDYEFFLARITSSKEIVGWIAISFVTEGNETIGRNKFEARLERTELFSNILKTWKVESSGGKSNVWEEIKRASSSLQAKHMPPDHCIINALVVYQHEQFEESGVANALLEHVIEYWRKQVEVGTEWAIWVQATAFAQPWYKNYGFDEVGEYNIELGDYGFLPKCKRRPSQKGKYGWKFMIRREPSGSAIDRPLVAPKLDKGKGKQQDLDDLQPDEDSQPQHEDRSKYDLAKYHKDTWESAEERLEKIWNGQGNPPLSGEVEFLKRVKRGAEEKGYIPPPRRSTGKDREQRVETAPPARPRQSKGKDREERVETAPPARPRQSKGKEREQREEIAPPAPRAEPPARPLQSNTKITSQPQDNFVPTKSEEDLIQAMREGGVDEEEIELVKALTFSLSDKVEGE